MELAWEIQRFSEELERKFQFDEKVSSFEYKKAMLSQQKLLMQKGYSQKEVKFIVKKLFLQYY